MASSDESVFGRIRMLLKFIVQDIRATELLILICVSVSLVMTLLSMVLSIYFFTSAVINVSKNSVETNIINERSFDYKVSKTFNSIFSFGFNYNIFTILPILQLIPIIIIIVVFYVRRKRDPSYTPNIPTTLAVLISVLVIQSLISLVFNNIAYFSSSSALTPINKRIASFNSYVYKRMYKGMQSALVPSMDMSDEGNQSTSLNFYSSLGEVYSNPFTLQSAIKDALHKLPPNISPQDLAKAFFTVSMFTHFHKLGVRNPSLYKAINQFKPIILLLPMLFTPSDFLVKKGTFIDDIGDRLADRNGSYLNAELLKKPDVVSEAVMLHSEWIAESNNRANSMFVEDATIPFFVMAVLILLSQTVTIGVLVYIFTNPSRRDALLRILVP